MTEAGGEGFKAEQHIDSPGASSGGPINRFVNSIKCFAMEKYGVIL